MSRLVGDMTVSGNKWQIVNRLHEYISCTYIRVYIYMCTYVHMSHAGNLDRFLGRKNMLTHMLAHPYAIGGFSYAGIWAFYGLTQGLRESKSPQSHLFS